MDQPVYEEVQVESDEDTSEFACNYWYKLKHEPLRSLYSHWKCTVHTVLIKVDQKLKEGDPCFVLCFKEVRESKKPNDDGCGNDFKLGDKKTKRGSVRTLNPALKEACIHAVREHIEDLEGRQQALQAEQQ